jgi:hypothetical protein
MTATNDPAPHDDDPPAAPTRAPACDGGRRRILRVRRTPAGGAGGGRPARHDGYGAAAFAPARRRQRIEARSESVR